MHSIWIQTLILLKGFWFQKIWPEKAKYLILNWDILGWASSFNHLEHFKFHRSTWKLKLRTIKKLQWHFFDTSIFARSSRSVAATHSGTSFREHAMDACCSAWLPTNTLKCSLVCDNIIKEHCSSVFPPSCHTLPEVNIQKTWPLWNCWV